jgi:arylsulfatase A-like enzyme
MKYLSIFISVLLFGGAFFGCKENNKVEYEETVQPNILFILTDDQRAGTIHAMGNTAKQTPNIDKLTQQGISYTNAYIIGSMVGAVCAPSRAMLMTGRPLFKIYDSGQSL